MLAAKLGVHYVAQRQAQIFAQIALPARTTWRQRKSEIGRKKSHTIAAIIALALKLVSVQGQFVDEICQRVGYLNFSVRAFVKGGQIFHDLRVKNIAANNRQIRRGVCGGGFFNQTLNGHQSAVFCAGVDNAIALRLVGGNRFNGDQIAAKLFILLDHLRQASSFVQHHVIGQNDGEGLVANSLARTPDGVTEPQGFVLINFPNFGVFGQTGLKQCQFVMFAARLKRLTVVPRR